MTVILIRSSKRTGLLIVDERGLHSVPVGRLDDRLEDLKADLGGRVFLHRNRDGSVAIATGSEPETWPEDERE